MPIQKASVLNTDGKDIGMKDVSFERDYIAYTTLLPDGKVIIHLCERITEEEYQLRNVGA